MDTAREPLLVAVSPEHLKPDSWLRRPQVTTWFARFFRGLAAACVVFAICLAAICLAAICLAIHPAAPDARHEGAVGAVFASFFLVYAAGCEALARRYASRGLFLSADAIIVRNLLSTQTIPLDDADSFSPGVPGGLSGPCPMLRCRTRSSVGVGGLGVAAFAWRYDATLRGLEPMCELLNGLLARLKDAPRPSRHDSRHQ